MSLTERMRRKAQDLGFDLVGIAPARPTPYLDAYRAWIAQGYHGDMGYLARPDRVERRADPDQVLPGVHSVVCVGLNYYSGALSDSLRADPSRGVISNYAWGQDYHDLVLPRLEALADFIAVETGGGAEREVLRRAYIDTGPVLERAYAAEAGLGFIGKNTCLIHPNMGSYLFLGEILLTLALDPTPGQTHVSCGTCQRCLDACPTGALVAPYVLDARRCISYLTIELKGPVPHDLRPLLGNRVYGCDVCQTVCPWQRFARPTEEKLLHAADPERAAPALASLIEMDDKAFRRRYKGSAMFRIKRRGLLRNAAIALGNWGDQQAILALARALSDVESLVRGHAAWALGAIGGPMAQDLLGGARQRERDPYVRREIDAAIKAL
jgi:epoxyqueuosine reductase